MTAPDRRQEPSRREEDKLVEYRLEVLEKALAQIETTTRALGSATGHLALLDHRSEENARRIGSLEMAVDRIEQTLTKFAVALENVRTRVLFFSAAGSLIGAGCVALLVKVAGG